jgi:hypothetical protein
LFLVFLVFLAPLRRTWRGGTSFPGTARGQAPDQNRFRPPRLINTALAV